MASSDNEHEELLVELGNKLVQPLPSMDGLFYLFDKMTGRLSSVASHIMGGNGVVCHSVASSLRVRSGMGFPVGKHIVPDKPLHVNDKLMWENGTSFPEPCIDRIADESMKHWLGYVEVLSYFVGLGLLAVWNDKASKIPFAYMQQPESRWLKLTQLEQELQRAHKQNGDKQDMIERKSYTQMTFWISFIVLGS